MKKLYFLGIVAATLTLSACTHEEPVVDNNIDETEKVEVQNHFFWNRENETSWTVAMQKPSIDEVENYGAIVNWYTGEWTNSTTLTEEHLAWVNGCNDVTAYWSFAGWYWSKQLASEDIKLWNTITITGTYDFEPMLSLTDNEKEVLTDKWRLITPISSIINFWAIDYSEDSAENHVYFNESSPNEEWARVYNAIWWSTREIDRNPANTILITNDLLLHSFHKLFDNTLKYYEQTEARGAIKELSNNLFNKFNDLAQNESDSELKEMYNFLAMYWVIPSILLVDEDDLRVPQYTTYGDEWSSFIESYNPTDEQMRGIITKNADRYLKVFDKEQQNQILEILNLIFDAKSTTPDALLMSYSPDFIVLNEIKQDYTQFAPRSHYIDNAELKTYFMAMKWLMREKFYFWDDKLAKTAMVMVANISDDETAKLSQLSEKIKKLVWWDDDLTLESLSLWMKENNFTDTDTILSNFSDEVKEELLNLVPQKIQSTAYSSEWMMTVDSEKAKDITAGFLFFGEKFTIDSYLFDEVTAWSAEKEFAFMPNMQTAMIIPEILESNSKAAELVNLWMMAREQKWDIREWWIYSQFSSYNDVKANAIEKIKYEIENGSIMDSVYHKWIDMIGYLINDNEGNAPYFKIDPTYILKSLVTYMWSYTELKHDTLLYVKQNYAELGWAGWGCDIMINPIALPVPKWYIEADLDVLNKLIELNSETMSDFDWLPEEALANFIEFDKFLQHIRAVLIQQMNNEVISDEDFEWMRTAYTVLWRIVFPTMSPDVTEKEMRSALIADIFTSEGPNPLYEAVGRPAIMLVMIDDVNGKRVALGPVFTHYEFYESDDIVEANWSRLNDIQWQAAYDEVSRNKAALSTVSKHLKKWFEVTE